MTSCKLSADLFFLVEATDLIGSVCHSNGMVLLFDGAAISERHHPHGSSGAEMRKDMTFIVGGFQSPLLSFLTRCYKLHSVASVWCELQ